MKTLSIIAASVAANFLVTNAYTAYRHYTNIPMYEACADAGGHIVDLMYPSGRAVCVSTVALLPFEVE